MTKKKKTSKGQNPSSALSANERKKAVAALMEGINQDMDGMGRISRASDYTLPHLVRRCPSGLPSLDIATAGGLPCGAYIEIAGDPGAGKTELCTLYMIRQQEIWGEEAALAAIMCEFHLDKLYAKERGLRIPLSDEEIEAMERAEGEKFAPEEVECLKEEVGSFSEGFTPVAEKLWDMVVRALRSRLYQMIMVDSLGALVPKTELESDIQGKKYPTTAVINTDFFHKFHAAMGIEEDGRANFTVVLGINQVRTKLQDAHNQLPHIGGGNSKDHAKSALILLETKAPIRRDKAKGDYTKIGKWIRWRVLKGKHGFHEGPEGVLRYTYQHGFDRAYDVLDQALKRDFIRKKGSWYSFAEDLFPSGGDSKEAPLVKEGKKIAQGADNAADYIRSQPLLLEALYDAILDDAGIHANVR